jgi:uncharacterized protein (TIGR00255 family)
VLSMTGLGVGEAVLEGGRVILELRALNHRFQDIRVRVPPSLSEHAFFLEQAARQKLGRGRYDVSVRTEGAAAAQPQISLERAESIYRSLCELRDRLAPGSEVPVTAVLGVPDVFVAALPNSDDARSTLERALDLASRSLAEMRRIEGAALEAELRGRLKSLWGLHARLAEHADQIVRDYRSRLSQRLTRLLEDGHALSTERLEQEVAILADRSDITEELVRLGSHLTQFGDLLAKDEAVGRRLDFLLQEIGREVNTIGAKAQHADQSRWVVDAKAEVERLREQVQNVD